MYRVCRDLYLTGHSCLQSPLTDKTTSFVECILKSVLSIEFILRDISFTSDFSGVCAYNFIWFKGDCETDWIRSMEYTKSYKFHVCFFINHNVSSNVGKLSSANWIFFFKLFTWPQWPSNLSKANFYWPNNKN